MRRDLAINGGPRVRDKAWPSWPVIHPEDEAAVLDVFRSGRWGRLGGNRTAEFEAAFAEYQGCTCGLAVFNGTVALQLALLAAGIGEGDEVIVPPYTFLATATSAILCNATPVFADIHPDTYCLDPDRVEEAITPRTRAIIPVHLGGRPADMDRICRIAAKHDLSVIEDCAHAHGSEYNGRRVGSLGDMGCFSFQASKNLTSGEGGIVVTNDEKLHATCDSIHNCGRVPDGEWYDHRALAMNLRITEFQSALLLRGLGRLDAETDTRDANGRYLDEKLAEIPGIRPLPRMKYETRHARHLYVFRYDAEAFGGVPRERFLEAVDAEGIPVSAGYSVPLYRQRIFTDKVFGPYTGYKTVRPDIDYAAVECPACEAACKEGCWIPQTALLATRDDMDDIVRAIQKVYEGRDTLR